MDINERINQLLQYGLQNNLIEGTDFIYTANRMIDILKLTSFERTNAPEDSLENILHDFREYAVENKLIGDSATERDLFDCKVMSLMTPRPSEVIRKFQELYNESPDKATDWYYHFSVATDYIRSYRVQKDVKWVYPCEYGDIDITINLSKPEKDPKAIALAGKTVSVSYPKCQLCKEAEGYAGRMDYPARANHRIIPLDLCGQHWFLQYSPYVYYNEHCICFLGEHKPMKVNTDTVRRALEFVTLFPHYFIGSNADIPIVGGSILSHDHMQGGHYTFAMAKAGIREKIHFHGFDDIEAGIVKWPMSVIRLTGKDRERILELTSHIFSKWESYSDKDAFLFAETGGERHNAITPIVRRAGENYQVDLVLRNNLTTEEYPLGVYHPHADKHNIKKENIGLIEVMGLAVLPSRLKTEMSILAEALVNGMDVRKDERISKHADWADRFRGSYTFTEENVSGILKKEIGRTFVEVLADAGVFKDTEEGRKAFDRFVGYVNAK